MIDRRLNYGRSHIARFLRQVAPFENVVDLGAGGGEDLALAEEVCPTAERFAVEAYAPNVEKLKVHNKVFVLDLEKDPLPFADESIDVVLCNQVLEHVKEIFWILHQVNRVLRVGGHLVIGVPNLASWHNRLLLLCGRQPTVIQNHSAHVRGYTKHDILRMFEMVFQAVMPCRDLVAEIFIRFRHFWRGRWLACCPMALGASFYCLRKSGTMRRSSWRIRSQRSWRRIFMWQTRVLDTLRQSRDALMQPWLQG